MPGIPVLDLSLLDGGPDDQARFRDELRRTDSVEEACARATARTSPAILASGGIVVASMLVLELADFNATREMGPILALGIIVMVAAGLTLLPAPSLDEDAYAEVAPAKLVEQMSRVD